MVRIRQAQQQQQRTENKKLENRKVRRENRGRINIFMDKNLPMNRRTHEVKCPACECVWKTMQTHLADMSAVVCVRVCAFFRANTPEQRNSFYSLRHTQNPVGLYPENTVEMGIINEWIGKQVLRQSKSLDLNISQRFRMCSVLHTLVERRIGAFARSPARMIDKSWMADPNGNGTKCIFHRLPLSILSICMSLCVCVCVRV